MLGRVATDDGSQLGGGDHALGVQIRIDSRQRWSACVGHHLPAVEPDECHLVGDGDPGISEAVREAAGDLIAAAGHRVRLLGAAEQEVDGASTPRLAPFAVHGPSPGEVEISSPKGCLGSRLAEPGRQMPLRTGHVGHAGSTRSQEMADSQPTALFVVEGDGQVL
jgi:hypothetical protein